MRRFPGKPARRARRARRQSPENIAGLFFLPLLLLFTGAMLCYPQAAYQGACRGLETWSTHLLPSLLPFFIAADLLLSTGFVRFLGVLLEPVMRPLFHLPGETGFAVALGFTSGFPTGAVLTASLREQELCTAQEAARLAAFTNNSSPLFLLIAVPVSMLHQPRLGVLLLAAHYLSNLTVGFLLRFAAPAEPRRVAPRRLWSAALDGLNSRPREPLGAMLGRAVQKGIDSILKIGGFVLFFSVLLSLLQESGLLELLQAGFGLLLGLFHLPPQLGGALSAGLFEMTLGSSAAAQSQAPLLPTLMVISFILGWGGLSVQAQVSSILAAQQISARLYCLCRPLQGILAALYVPLFAAFFPDILTVSAMQKLEPLLAAAPCLPFLLFPVCALSILLLLAALFRLGRRIF